MLREKQAQPGEAGGHVVKRGRKRGEGVSRRREQLLQEGKKK